MKTKNANSDEKEEEYALGHFYHGSIRRRIKKAVDEKNMDHITQYISSEKDMLRVMGAELLITDKEDREGDFSVDTGFKPVVNIMEDRTVLKISPFDINKVTEVEAYALLHNLKKLKETHFLEVRIELILNNEKETVLFGSLGSPDEDYILPEKKEKADKERGLEPLKSLTKTKEENKEINRVEEELNKNEESFKKPDEQTKFLIARLEEEEKQTKKGKKFKHFLKTGFKWARKKFI
ncbi:MAG: hypothetical protein GY858_09950 [Candidatus Omnitrophica bacterium]|nr:hypothetical protein [Candidatus Omnitrophota bacterium]